MSHGGGRRMAASTALAGLVFTLGATLIVAMAAALSGLAGGVARADPAPSITFDTPTQPTNPISDTDPDRGYAVTLTVEARDPSLGTVYVFDGGAELDAGTYTVRVVGDDPGTGHQVELCETPPYDAPAAESWSWSCHFHDTAGDPLPSLLNLTAQLMQVTSATPVATHHYAELRTLAVPMVDADSVAANGGSAVISGTRAVDMAVAVYSGSPPDFGFSGSAACSDQGTSPGPWSCTIDTSALGPGEHDYSVRYEPVAGSGSRFVTHSYFRRITVTVPPRGNPSPPTTSTSSTPTMTPSTTSATPTTESTLTTATTTGPTPTPSTTPSASAPPATTSATTPPPPARTSPSPTTTSTTLTSPATTSSPATASYQGNPGMTPPTSSRDTGTTGPAPTPPPNPPAPTSHPVPTTPASTTTGALGASDRESGDGSGDPGDHGTDPPGTDPSGPFATFAHQFTAVPSVFGHGIETMAQTMAKPTSVVTAAAALGGAFVLFVALPSELLHATLRHNYGRAFALLIGWWGRWKRSSARLIPASPPRWLVGAGILVVGSMISAAAMAHTVAIGVLVRLTLAMFAGFLTTNVLGVIIGRHIGHRWNAHPQLHLMPAFLLLTAVSVLFSRLMGLHPAVMFGILMMVTFRRSLPRKHTGGYSALICGTFLAIGVLAWGGYSLLDAAAAGFMAQFAGEYLTTLVTGCVGYCMVALLPITYLDGRTIIRWSKWVWGGLYAVTIVVFQFTVLRLPGTWERASGLVVLWTVIFGAFGVISLAVWAWFRFRPALDPPPAAEVG